MNHTTLTFTLVAAATGGCLDTRPIDLGADDDTAAETGQDVTAGDDDTAADGGDDDTAADGADDASPETTAPACLTVSPGAIDFGATALGVTSAKTFVVSNCADAAVDVTRVTVSGDDAFAIDLAPLPATLPPGGTLELVATYRPDALSVMDGAGWVRDLAELVVTAGTEVKVPLSGFAPGETCPVARIVIPEGEVVLPQTRLHLIGSQSLAVVGEIASYEWRVIQPGGSVSTFMPSAYVPDPMFDVNVSGIYTFQLTVYDSRGVVSCAPAEATVTIDLPPELHIELTWDDPGEAAPDLDLHLRHALASDWFDPTYDAYWGNHAPSWGNPNISYDDPSLDVDDMDGAGPENLTLDRPEDGVRYCVGVHVYAADPALTITPTVRVYTWGVLRYEATDVPLVVGDLWEPTCFTWQMSDHPTFETLTDATGGPRVEHGVTVEVP